MLKRIIILLFLFAFSLSVFANSTNNEAAKIDRRRYLLPCFYNSYIGLLAGYGKFNFTNANLNPPFKATGFDNNHMILQAYIGHYFNPYIAAQLSLMRPIQWITAFQITGSGTHTIWMSIFGFDLRPTWPVTSRFSLYALAGGAYISRHGIYTQLGGNMQPVISDEGMFSYLVGGGMSYAVTKNWHLDVNVNYVGARKELHQPSTFYVGVGAYYYLAPLEPGTKLPTPYLFHANTFVIGFFTSEFFNVDAGKYLTPPYLPIFWDGGVKLHNAVYLMYMRNVFHTERTFSLDLGASLSRYVSANLRQVFYAISIFPAIRVWIIRSKELDFYFFYSLAGPTYISKQFIDNNDTGKHFTFQDLLGFGFYLGRGKHFNLNVMVGHYSNGNLFSQNPGIAVPLNISLGYAFS